MAKSRHPKRTPSPGPSNFQKKLAAAQEIRMKRQDTLTQMMLDSMVIAANQTFKRKGDIIRDLCANTMEVFNEIARLTVEDAKDDPAFEYTKAKLDDHLRYILGEHFQPCEERYR